MESERAEGENCQICGRIERKTAADDLNGLTWLCPDEIWICDSCLKRKMRRVIKVAQ